MIDKNQNKKTIEIPAFNKNLISNLSHLELNSLYNIAGYIVKSITKICTTCKKCIRSVRSPIPLRFSFTKLVQLKCYTTHSLYFVNIETFKIFIKLEQMFRYYSHFFNDFQNINWTLFLSTEFSKVINANHIFNCHNLYFKIIKRFVTFRLKIHNKKNTIRKKHYNSKSMAMHALF